MAADFSRVRMAPLLDYAGVELKQGGVLLDADANELVAILDRRLRALASDTLGRATVSAATPGAFKLSVSGGDLLIDQGRLYVDGLLAENHGDVSADPARRRFDPLMAEPAFADPVPYSTQPHPPVPAALPGAGLHLVYLDVWNREVTHLERPDLVESAVGVETSSRLQTVWQVRLLESNANEDLSCATPDDAIPGWSELVAPSSGVLTTGTFDVPDEPDPCELPPTGGYRGLENQLYRVEIHDPGQPGGGASFKWSRENASVGSRVASIASDSELELDTLGRDDVLRISSNDWVEITNDAREFSHAAGEMRRVTVDEATRRIRFTPALPGSMLPAAFPDSDLPQQQNLRVRRWDQHGPVFRTDPSGTPVQVQDLDSAGSSGVIAIPAGDVTLLLEHGIGVRFASTGAKGFKAGDHWEFAARSADARIEELDRAPPRGIHHHYARLGILDAAAGAVSDCRHPWPPAGGGQDCACTHCVTPESHNGGIFTIQDAVDKLLGAGGTICLRAGQYALRAPVRIAGARSLRISGQGTATMLLCSGAAFVIERSAAIAIDELAVVSLGRQAAVCVRTAFGLALRKLALAVVGQGDFRGAAIALSGAVLGATIDNNLILATDGVCALEPETEEAPRLLLAAVLRIDDNLFLCRDSAVRLAGRTGHVLQTRMCGNQVVGSHAVGLSSEGFALPGASIRFHDNDLDVHGAGIRCAAGGAWIDSNRLRATRDGERPLAGVGIDFVSGLDKDGGGQCQILANQLSGFPDAAIRIAAPLRELIVKLNQIEQCGHGIQMAGGARAVLVAIENNQLRAIGQLAGGGGGGGIRMTLGIGITRADSAIVAGNMLRGIGLDAAENRLLVAGIAAFSVQRLRAGGNDIVEVGPLEDSVGGEVAGITVRAPYVQADIDHNHVERDAGLVLQPSRMPWFALHVDAARDDAILARLAGYVTLRVDAVRTVVLFDDHAWVGSAAAGIDVTGAVVVQASSASVLGNTFIGRGQAALVDVDAGAEVLFNSNRCEMRADGALAVLLRTPIAILHANRVRGGTQASIMVADGRALVSAVGNITTGAIAAPLRPEMLPLNLNG